MTTAFICLLLLGGASYHRTPDKARVVKIPTDHTWVFFTDKGIDNSKEYSTAIRLLSKKASPIQVKRRSREPVKGFDFDDLPVKESYVRQIEALGGRVRTVSNWLNAASFELPPGIIKSVYALPFVYDLKPVTRRTFTESNPPIPLHQENIPARAVDTAEAHRFYGPSYDQVQMMGIPGLFFQGFFGSNVKLAIFDTGLKLKNVAVKNLRIYKQHDFLSGDNFYTADNAWTPQPVDKLRYFGLIKDPALIYSQSTGSGTVLLAFVADSFSYVYSSPRRAIFVARSTDFGSTWTEPVPIVFSQPTRQLSAHTFENLGFAGYDSITYLVYNDLSFGYSGSPGSGIYLGYFLGTHWHTIGPIGPGRFPDIRITDDTLYICYIENDSTVVFKKAEITLSEPTPHWTTRTALSTTELLSRLELVSASGEIIIIASARKSGRIVQFRSTDGGATFSPPEELVPADAYDVHLEQNGAGVFLFYKDNRPPLTTLSLLYSDNLGLDWTTRPEITDSTLSIGGFATSSHQSDITLVYETGGLLYRTSSTDLGNTWQEPVLLDTAGFCYMPCLASRDTSLLATWLKRGDDNTVWEQTDTIKFSREQPNHGTRMASIIAGYNPMSIVGVAPGVDLMFAKTELYKVSSERYYEYNMEEDTYIEALEWAERSGADIVSTSLGYRGWYSDDQFDGKTAPISIAAALAAKRGLIVVTAMGNRDTLIHPWPHPYIVAPADADGVIAAGGIERNMLPWRGTGTGPTSDGRIKPELVALSDTVAVAAPDSVNALEGSVGTSCATALIAGCCALLKEAHPDWSADSVKAALFATATRSTQNCTLGFGVPRIDSAFKRFPPESEAPPVPSDEIEAFPNPFVKTEHDQLYFAINLTRPAPLATICIYSTSGALVDTIGLNTEPMGQPGHYRDILILDAIGAHWDGKTLSGKPAASGLYLAVLKTTFGHAVGKFALVR